jgi:hypothetical protein
VTADRRRPRSRRAAALPLALALLAGCATVPYDYDAAVEGPRILALRAGEEQVERGRPNAFLDGLGHYVLSLPSKLILLNWNVDDHDISAETEQSVREYLDANGLHQVKVRLNQYKPGDEWRRLGRNRDVNGFWRFTFGALTVISYTAFPGRAFGGDNYNPYTNTINLYSDDRAIALHEAGHAKDLAELRRFKGAYSALRVLPLVPLWQEAEATGDAIGWERERGGGDDERHAYRALYPAWGTYVGGEAARWIPGPAWLPYALAAAGAVPGHVAGWVRSAFVEDRPRPPPFSPAAPEPLAAEALPSGRPPPDEAPEPVAPSPHPGP